MAFQIGFNGYYKAQIAVFGNALSIGSGGGSYVGDSFSTLAETRTTNYTLNGATGVFNMPAGSNVIFSEMQICTSGTFGSDVFLTTPTESITIPNSNFTSYPGSVTVKYIDITTIIDNGGSGTYSIQNVQGSTAMLLWAIFVVYENTSLYDINYIYYARDNTIIAGSTVTTTLNQVYTPVTGPITGYLLRTGTATDTVDTTRFTVNGVTMGNTSNPWNGLSPYNPSTQCLPGIICVANPYESTFGLLDTRVTFGNANANPYNATRPNPNRAYVDIAGFNISNALSNGQASVTFTEVSPGGGFYSHIAAFQINAQLPIITPVKSANKVQTFNGDVVTYTVTLTNTGNYIANNVTLIDTLPSQLSFINGSVNLNGTTMPASSILPPSGFNIGSLDVNEVATLTFAASVVNAIVGVTINNVINATYANSPATFSSLSNTVPIGVILLNLTTNKYRDKAYGTIGDTITYSINFNFQAASIIEPVTIIDDLPTDISFVPNSLNLNGTPIAGDLSSPGLTLTSISNNTLNTITFNAVIVSIPSFNPAINSATILGTTSNISLSSTTNIVSTTILGISLVNSKYVDKSIISLGETITYSIGINNYGNTSATNVIFIDTLPNGVILIPGTLYQDSTPISGDPNPPGITLPNNINSNSETTITFKVLVNTIPNPYTLVNAAFINASYTVNPVSIPNDIRNSLIESNTVETIFKFIDLSKISKTVDRVFATTNTILTYTIVIPNLGNIPVNNAILIDTIPYGTSFLSDSVIVNGIISPGANPETGINLGNINPLEVVTIEFKVIVD